MMGVIPVSIHSASEDVVLYALAILKLMSRFIASNHTGAPYESNGRMAALYIVAIASCLIPHCSLAAVCMYVFFLFYFACSITCSNVCTYVCMYFF